MNDKIFVDTNLWIYLFSNSESIDDKKKNESVKNLLRKSSDIIISAQVLSEVSNVLLGKMAFPVEKIRNIIFELVESFEVKPVDDRDISYALDIVDKYKISWYDALIVASAINSKTKILYSEDFQNGLEIDRSIKIINSFN